MNFKKGYFCGFLDYGPCGLPEGFYGKNTTTLLGAGLVVFWPKICPEAWKSAKIEKMKKYGFFKVNSGTGYFFDFLDSGPCDHPGAL